MGGQSQIPTDIVEDLGGSRKVGFLVWHSWGSLPWGAFRGERDAPRFLQARRVGKLV